MLNVTDNIRFADVGCGYGGLLVQLSPMFPDKLMLGLEIRVKVSDYVRDRWVQGSMNFTFILEYRTLNDTFRLA